MPCEIYYTSRIGKKKYMDEKGICIDVWIDDSPVFILEDAWTGD